MVVSPEYHLMSSTVTDHMTKGIVIGETPFSLFILVIVVVKFLTFKSIASSVYMGSKYIFGYMHNHTY